MLAAVRSAHPGAHIAWLVGRSFAPLLAGHPLIDELIVFDRKRLGRMWWDPGALAEFWRLVRQLRQSRFDIAVDLQGLIRSGFFAWVSGARRRVGFAAARELGWAFYSERVQCPQALHAVDRNLRVAHALGWPVERPGFPLAVTPEERADARSILRASGIERAFIAVLPGARWPSKCWSEHRFAELLDQLDQEGLPPCVLLGAPDERARNQRIARACASPPADLSGKTTLRQLTAILEQAGLVICQDSGPMHLAAALDRPMVALFGPTDPRRTGPWSTAARVVAHAVPCQPCLRRVCPLKHHDCLARLEVRQVLRAIREITAQPARASNGNAHLANELGAAGFEPA